MRVKRVMILFMICMFFLALAGCSKTDVIAKVAVSSFDTLVETIPDQVQYDNIAKGWALTGVDGKDRIILSKDFSNNPDITIEIEAESFVKAGLDVSKLSADQYSYDEDTAKIVMSFEYNDKKFAKSSEESVLKTFKQIIKNDRLLIGYHAEGDHYMITLGNGNIFAWAKEIETNKTDMGFILNPDPFIDAGLDTSKLDGWVFAKMPATDKDGKMVKIDKLIKGFNIK